MTRLTRRVSTFAQLRYSKLSECFFTSPQSSHCIAMCKWLKQAFSVTRTHLVGPRSNRFSAVFPNSVATTAHLPASASPSTTQAATITTDAHSMDTTVTTRSLVFVMATETRELKSFTFYNGSAPWEVKAYDAVSAQAIVRQFSSSAPKCPFCADASKVESNSVTDGVRMNGMSIFNCNSVKQLSRLIISLSR